MSNGSNYLLLIEDEPTVQSNNEKILKRRGYSVKQAYTLEEAARLVEMEEPSGIILDIKLPDGNGLDFLRTLRKTTKTPVLILTAMNTNEDIINGLEAGCDDYLAKPYDLSVFLLRIENMLRKSSAVPEVVEFHELKLYPTSARALIDGFDLCLSQKEFGVLLFLAQNPDKIYQGDVIFNNVWGYKMAEGETSLKTMISKLRKKLTNVGFNVASSKGEGYYLEKL